MSFGFFSSLFLIQIIIYHSQIDGVTNATITRQQFRIQVIRLVKSLLKEFDVNEGDVIGICLENRFEFPLIVFAAFCLGMTVAPLNVTYTDRMSEKKEKKLSQILSYEFNRKLFILTVCL